MLKTCLFSQLVNQLIILGFCFCLPPTPSSLKGLPMLLPHPKYKGPFIALPAPSFSSKLITSRAWMTLESEAPRKPPLGFSEERFPSPNTAPALSQAGRQGFALLGHIWATQHKLLPPLHPDTLLHSNVGPPALPHPVSGQQHGSLHPAPHVCYLQRQQWQVLDMLLVPAACIGMLCMQLPKLGSSPVGHAHV